MKPQQDNLEFQLSQYLDGQLSGRARRKLESQLAQDPALQEELTKYAALEEHLDGMVRQGPSGVDYDAQRSEIISSLERKSLLEARSRQSLIFRPVFWAPAMAIAASLIVALGVWTYVRGPAAGPMPGPIAQSSAVVQVAVLPAAPASASAGQAQMVLRRLDLKEQLDLQTDNAGDQYSMLDADEPTGKVVVSYGVKAPAPAVPPGMMPFPAETQ